MIVGRTVLNAVRTPLALRNLSEDDVSLVEDFIYDTILRRFFKVLEGMLNTEHVEPRNSLLLSSTIVHSYLHNKGAGFMTS